jgi:hypothetical protein
MKAVLISMFMILAMPILGFADQPTSSTYRCEFEDRLVGQRHVGVGLTEEEARYAAWQSCRAHLGNGASGYASYCDYSYERPWADEWRCEQEPPQAP